MDQFLSKLYQIIQNRYIEIHLWNCRIYNFAKKKVMPHQCFFFSIVRRQVVCIQLEATSLFKIRVLSRKKGNLFLKVVEIGISSSNLQNRKPLWHYYIIIHILVVSVCNLCMHWSEMVIMYFSYIFVKIMKVKFCQIRYIKFKYFEE